MSAQTVTQAAGNAVARTDTGPRAMVAQYSTSFSEVLPTHVRPEQWVRLAQGALKKGKKAAGDRQGRTELEVAAANNPGVFLASLLDAARLGLEPGTEAYYLTPRKVKGRLEILGIVGYQGMIELMYRAGAVSSVVAEVVYAGDGFRYRPGVDERPVHEVDWDADDRGPLRLAYAYAIMKDGATSKVIVLNAQAIARIRKRSQGADSEYSPWNTDEPAMWLKSTIRQLVKWVPTSAEYRRAERISTGAVDSTTAEHVAVDVARQLAGPQQPPTPVDVSALPELGEVLDGDLAGDDDAEMLAEHIETEAAIAAADDAGEP